LKKLANIAEKKIIARIPAKNHMTRKRVMKNFLQYYTIMDLLLVEYAVLLTRKSDIDRGEAEVNI
jgi:hypothetical protein